MVAVDGWSLLIVALARLPEGVYEIRGSGGEKGDQIAAATTDGRGAWHLWHDPSVR